jgi:2-dehydro-3-deoxy-D-arabinonate dehydratase
MNLCRFKGPEAGIRVGLVVDRLEIIDLSAAGITRLQPLLEREDALIELKRLSEQSLPRFAISGVRLCAPAEAQEVWAAGVTYSRSKTARMEESSFSATAYDRVYDAERPELFFKSMPEKVVATGEPVGIRKDAKWSVPEPELALVLNSHGKVAGLTIGNDMSSRDIEGENLLYLPQAKIYNRSCALGPWIAVGISEALAREWSIGIEIRRNGKRVFQGETSVGKIKRRFGELAEYLFRSQVFANGAILLTGTGVVPPETFTLQAGDFVEIEIDGIGLLQNPVIVV